MNAAKLLQALAFAAHKHREQRRKDAGASPYINHPIAVAAVLATDGHVTDETVLIAAVLHDTVEDTKTTFEELGQHFGPAVAEIVRELTDDKSLAKQERKRLQIEQAPHVSGAAKQIKIADKICNIRDLRTNPPAGWPRRRQLEYLAWSKRVVSGCLGVNPRLEAAFTEAIAAARAALRAKA